MARAQRLMLADSDIHESRFLHREATAEQGRGTAADGGGGE
jgi:hypothetical protein